MIKVVGFPHPFLSSHEDFEVEHGLTYREIVARVQPSEALRSALVSCEDEPILEERWGEVAPDGKTVIVKIVPQGTGGTGGDIAKGGSFTFLAGLVVFATLGWTGIGAVIGLGLMGVGAVAMATGGIVSMVGRFASYQDRSVESNPSIAGSSNTYGAGRPVPIIIGKHLVTPFYGASPYTELGGTDGVEQYLHLLFVVGLGPLKLSNLKIGDNLLATNSADVRNGAISVSDGNYSDVQVQVYQNGDECSLYPKLVVEEQIGVELKNADAATAHIYTTPKKTTRIEADIVFTSGLLKYDSSGNKQNATVAVTAYYRAKGATSWSTLGTISTTRAKAETMRFNVGLNVAAGEYEVRLARTTADSTDSNTVDKVAWLCLRSFRSQYPIDSSVLANVVTVAMRIKATDQLSGVVDKFNLIAESLYPAYSGSGSGSSAWVAGASSNPAAAYLYFLRGGANPREVPDSLVDWETLEDWYAHCATKGFECNAVVASDSTLKAMLERIALTGRASLTLRDGLYSVVVDKPRTTPVQFFTPRNSRDFIGQKDFPEVIHGYRISFINADNDYANDEIIVLDDGYLYDIDSDGTLEDAFGVEYASIPEGYAMATLFEEISLWGVVKPSQVWKHARYLIACRRLRPETFQITTGIASLRCQRGDLVRVAHDVPLLGLAYGRVQSLITDESGNVIGITTDEECPVELGKTYGIRLQDDAGTLIERTIVAKSEAGNYTSLEFTLPILEASAPAVDSMFAFGESGLETVPMILAGYEGLEDQESNLTLVEYNEAIYNADSGTIPAYESKTSRAKQFLPSRTVEESGDQTTQLPTAADAATYNYSNNIAPTNNVTELAFTSEANADGSVDVGVSFKYTQGSVPAAGFLIYAKSGPTEPVNILASDQAAKFISASADAGEQTYGASLQALSVRYGGAGALPRVYHFAVVAVSQCVGGTIPHNAGLVEVSGWTAKTFAATITDIAIKSYKGQGVNRRAIKIDAESLDWLDAPLTDPATDELLLARIGRLGVGGSVLMDGDFYSPLTSTVSGSTLTFTPTTVIDENFIVEDSSGQSYLFYLTLDKLYRRTIDSTGTVGSAVLSDDTYMFIDFIVTCDPDGYFRIAGLAWDSPAKTSSSVYEYTISPAGVISARSQLYASGTPVKYLYDSAGNLQLYINFFDGTIGSLVRIDNTWSTAAEIITLGASSDCYDVMVDSLGDDDRVFFYTPYVNLPAGDVYLRYRTLVDGTLGSQVITAEKNPDQITTCRTLSGDIMCVFRNLPTWGSSPAYWYFKYALFDVNTKAITNTIIINYGISSSPVEYNYSTVQTLTGNIYFTYQTNSTYHNIYFMSLQMYGKVGSGIIERGSNSNGSYIKFGDGTLVCRRKGVSNQAINIGPFNGYYYQAINIVFPIAFYSTTDLSISGTTRIAGTLITHTFAIDALSASGVPMYILSLVSFPASDIVYSFDAIGRWKA